MSGPRIQRYYAESPEIREAEVLPRQIMVLHGRPNVNDIVHIPGGQRVITGSNDGSIRVWDLESGAEIGDRWQVEGYPISVKSIALSPNGIALASGYENGTVTLWDIGTGKVIVKWNGHTDKVRSMCWSPDGERVVSGSDDGTARVWNGQSGEPVVGLNPMINLEYRSVRAVAYSPDGTKIAAGGEEKNALKICDARTGELLSTVEFQEERPFIIIDDDESQSGCIGQPVLSLVWALDGKKLISGFQCGWIRIFDTTTWQEVAIINLDRHHVRRMALFRNDRLLASATWSGVRLWNLDTNLPVGPRLVHDNVPDCLAFSDDGKLVVGAGAYLSVWDTHAIVKDAGSEDLMTIPDKSFLDADATGGPTGLPAELEEEYQGRFFDDTPDGNYSSAPGYHNSSARHRHGPFRPSGSRSRVLFSRLSSLLRQLNTDETTELQQPPRRSIFSRHGPHVVEVAAIRDKQALYVAPRPRVDDKVKPRHGQSQGQAQASISQTLPAAGSASTTSPDPATTAADAASAAQSSPVVIKPSWWARLVLFVCCASAQYTNRQ